MDWKKSGRVVVMQAGLWGWFLESERVYKYNSVSFCFMKCDEISQFIVKKEMQVLEI